MMKLKTLSFSIIPYVCAFGVFCCFSDVTAAETISLPQKGVESLIDSSHKGTLFIVSGPSGTGKTTLVEMLMKEFPNDITPVISYTTRKMRPGEVNGVHYHFISEDVFNKMVENQEFLEYTKLFGASYGASKKGILDEQMKGKQVFLVINTETALQVQKETEATLIFISPPSIDTIKERLQKRGTETESVIALRVAEAEKEMKDGKFFDYKVVNDNLSSAYQIFKSIVIAKNHEIES